MAQNRYIGDYPVIGIRPVVDGRRGPQMMRESLEPLVWAMAESAKKLFEENGKTQEDITNLLLVNYNVEQLDKIITAEDEIERLYINFCNPWPRCKHKKRRLTYYKKLEMYKTFLKKDAEIRFKTDDDELFEESLEYFEQSGYEITYITRDLHNSDVKDNIETEHEKMFSAEGIKIKYCIAKQK